MYAGFVFFLTNEFAWSSFHFDRGHAPSSLGLNLATSILLCPLTGRHYAPKRFLSVSYIFLMMTLTSAPSEWVGYFFLPTAANRNQIARISHGGREVGNDTANSKHMANFDMRFFWVMVDLWSVRQGSGGRVPGDVPAPDRQALHHHWVRRPGRRGLGDGSMPPFFSEPTYRNFGYPSTPHVNWVTFSCSPLAATTCALYVARLFFDVPFISDLWPLFHARARLHQGVWVLSRRYPPPPRSPLPRRARRCSPTPGPRGSTPACGASWPGGGTLSVSQRV